MQRGDLLTAVLIMVILGRIVQAEVHRRDLEQLLSAMATMIGDLLGAILEQGEAATPNAARSENAQRDQ